MHSCLQWHENETSRGAGGVVHFSRNSIALYYSYYYICNFIVSAGIMIGIYYNYERE
jgi:hypothetical protein